MGSRKHPQLGVKRQNSTQKAAAAKRRAVARRMAATATTGAKKEPDKKEIQPKDKETKKKKTAAVKQQEVSEKPSRHTMRVSLKAPLKDLPDERPTSDKKPSQHTMRVSLKAPSAQKTSTAGGSAAKKAAPQKEAGKVENKVTKITMDSLEKEPPAKSMKPPKETMRVSLKAPPATPGATIPAVQDEPEKKGRPKRKRASKNKKKSKKQAFDVVKKGGNQEPEDNEKPMNQTAIPKETMRVSLKAPAPGSNTAGAVNGGVRPETNRFVQGAQNPEAVAPAPVTPAAPQMQEIPASSQPIATGGQNKSAMKDLLVIVGYALGFLAVILIGYFIFGG